MVDVGCVCGCGRHRWLEVDTYGRLASLTYLGTDAVEAQNLTCLVGRYEAQLNHLTRLHGNGHVTDFIE